MEVVLDSLVWVEESHITAQDEACLKKDLTIRPRGFEGEKPPVIQLLHKVQVIGEPTYYGMPVHYGLKFVQRKAGARSMHHALSMMVDCRSSGQRKEYPKLPTPRDEEQKKFFSDLFIEGLQRTTVLAQGPTGSGKTVAALDTIARLQLNALVICPTGKIARQWVKACIDSNILGLCADDIGFIGAGKFEYEDKKIVVAIIHNLTDVDRLPSGFARYFGVVVWDEAHNLAARTFSETMLNVNPQHRIALTATPERQDGCANVFLHYFGPPCVTHLGDALPAKCRVFDYDWGDYGKELQKKPTWVRQKIVQACAERNLILARKIVRMYEAGRQILVLGKAVAHLQIMIGLCADLGVPDNDLGLFTRTYTTEDGKKIRILDKDLDFVAETCNIIFATEKMGKEGLDIERLDAGADIYPSAKGTQAIGRIRRPVEGKYMPLWITIRDVGVYSMEEMTRSRLRDYRNNNVEVIESGKA